MWKSVYSDLTQANRRILLDNGGSIKNLCNDWDNDCLANLYRPYFVYVKQCNNGNTFGNCWTSLNKWYWLGKEPVTTWGNNTGVILNNGVTLLFENWAKNCMYDSYGDCGVLMVDVNGFNGPNTIGKDIFSAHILEGNLKPLGSAGDDNENDCSPSLPNSGSGCGAMYLIQ